MSSLAESLRHADYFLWIGDDAIHVWDCRRGVRKRIGYLQGESGQIPYVPGFTGIWENIAYYKEQFQKIAGRRFLRKYLIMMIVPEDLSVIETRALNEFVYVVTNGMLKHPGLLTCSQSLTLHFGGEDYIALTQTCRSYCIALVKNGAVAEKILVDIQEIGPGDFDRNLKEFCEKYGCETLNVYYPGVEEGRIPQNAGTAVDFERIARLISHPAGRPADF